MLCTACRKSFEAKRHQEGPRFCSNKCRAAFWRKRRVQAQDERDREITGLLEEALRVLEGEDRQR